MIAPDLRVEYSGDGLRVLFQGRNLYHEKAPRERAEATARQIQVTGNCLLIVPSPLAGYGIDILLDRLPESSHILCVEGYEELMRLSVSSIPEHILKDPRISFVRTASAAAALLFIEKKIKNGRLRRTQTVLLNRGYGLNPELYRQIADEILLAIQTFWRNRMTSLHMGRLWMKNFFLNLSLLPSAQTLSAFSLEKPTVVAGAGESIEEAIPFLSVHRDSLQIVAVDTALPVLQSAGIRPDLIVIAEAQYANFYDFTALQDWSIPAAVDIT
jgi:hypothetical protein